MGVWVCVWVGGCVCVCVGVCEVGVCGWVCEVCVCKCVGGCERECVRCVCVCVCVWRLCLFLLNDTLQQLIQYLRLPAISSLEPSLVIELRELYQMVCLDQQSCMM